MDVARDIRWIRDMGLRRYIRMTWACAPMYDRTLAYALYWRDEPFVMSSALAHLVDAKSRTDFSALPGVNQSRDIAGRIGEWGHCRNWTVLNLGDIDHAVPTVAGLGEINAYLDNLPQKRSLAIAGAKPAGRAEARMVCVRDSGEVLPMAPELPMSLGYGPRDDRWVPGHWADRFIPPNVIEQGSDVIRTGDGLELPSRLRWLRMSTEYDITVYVVRLLCEDDDDFEHWNVVELADGIPDDANEALARIDTSRRRGLRTRH